MLARLCFAQGITQRAEAMARKSWYMGKILYNARAVQAERLLSEIALLRVQEVGEEIRLLPDRWRMLLLFRVQ